MSIRYFFYRVVARLMAVLLAVGMPLAARPVRAEETVRIGGTGAALALVRQLGAAFERRHRNIRILVAPSIGSSGGIKAVARGTLDIGLTSRPLDESERSLDLAVHEFARTPLVFATSSERSTISLSLDEVVSIYAGDITTWPDGSRIRLVLRPRSDADVAIIRALSPTFSEALDEALERPGMLIAATDQENAQLLTEVPGALGITTLTQIVTEKRRLVAITLEGASPATAAGADPSYPHSKTLYLVVRRPPSPAAERFLSFLRSAAARHIIERGGAVTSPASTEHAP